MASFDRWSPPGTRALASAVWPLLPHGVKGKNFLRRIARDEQGRYLERVYKWMKRVGIETVKKQVMDDLERRKGLRDRFDTSQKFAQIDPWAERVAGKDAHEFRPMADMTRAEAAE